MTTESGSPRAALPVRSIEILGVRVDDVTHDETDRIVRELLRCGRRWQLVTPNAEIVVQARRDPEFRAILNRSALALPDGFGLLLAARLRGTPLREQVTGTDTVVDLCRVAADEGWRVFFLGAGEGVADEAASRLRARYPSLKVAGTFAGSPRPHDDALVRDRLRQAGPIDLLFVAYGAPAQERWIDRNLPFLDVGAAMGVGGAFDFIAGRVPRAPGWVRRLGFDWLFRLVNQPWRWRRQLALPRFIALAAIEAATVRFGGRREHSDG